MMMFVPFSVYITAVIYYSYVNGYYEKMDSEKDFNMQFIKN